MIQLKNITKSFDLNKNKVEVLKGINLQIADDEFIALMGPSGSGKSTLLGILAGIDSPTSGEIYIYGQDISKKKEDELARFRNENVGIVFQAYNLIPSLNAIQNVKAPLYAGKNKLTSKEIDERAKKLLDMVGLSHRETHKPGELSGGEQQRVAIARALADEPTGNLDPEHSNEIWDMILKLNQERGQTFVIVTHDVANASKAQVTYNLSEGKLEKR